MNRWNSTRRHLFAIGTLIAAVMLIVPVAVTALRDHVGLMPMIGRWILLSLLIAPMMSWFGTVLILGVTTRRAR